MTAATTSSVIDLAVNLFREHERARLLADRKERDMLTAVRVMASDPAYDEQARADYHRLTTEVLDEYAEKRAKEGL